MLEAVATDRYWRQVAILYYRHSGRRCSVNRLMVEQGSGQRGNPWRRGNTGGGGGCAGGVRVVAAVTD